MQLCINKTSRGPSASVPLCPAHQCPWDESRSRLLGARAAGEQQNRRRREKHPEANSLSKSKEQGKAGPALTASLSVSMWVAVEQFSVWSGSTGSSFMPPLHCSYQGSHTSAEITSFSRGSQPPKLVPVSAWLGSQPSLQLTADSLPHSHE